MPFASAPALLAYDQRLEIEFGADLLGYRIGLVAVAVRAQVQAEHAVTRVNLDRIVEPGQLLIDVDAEILGVVAPREGAELQVNADRLGMDRNRRRRPGKLGLQRAGRGQNP